MSNSVAFSPPEWAHQSEERSVIHFVTTPTAYDASKVPVLIVGQIGHIKALPWQYVSTKYGNVTQQTWCGGLESLSPMDTISLHLRTAHVAALPTRCSRHNSPCQARALAKVVRAFLSATAPEQAIVVACPYEHVFPSACAIARSLPLFNLKSSALDTRGSGGGKTRQRVYVEFWCPGSEGPGVIQQLSPADIRCVTAAGVGVRLAAQIVDMPCNFMNTDAFIQKIQSVANELNLEPTIIRGQQLDKLGFGGIYGVGKAARHEPALVSLTYTPPPTSDNDTSAAATTPLSIALVGKGIVFDTGGLCIKTKTGMPGMKRDCGGAAAILGAFYTAVKSGFSTTLHAVFCLAENAVGPDATRPDDIHQLYSGKTVEINNTDAEGRLVLADGVVYAERDLGATVILDMATLTGAQGIATGKYHAALVTNDEHWEHQVVSAGLNSGDMVHPLPYCPELHFSEFSSAVADMKNSVADRSNAQSSCAGLFIGAQLGFDFPGVWIHVDMASPVHCGERATGYGVALIATLFGRYSTQRMLQCIAPSNIAPSNIAPANVAPANVAPANSDDTPSKKLRTQ